jgi:ribonuclease Z
VTHFAFLGTSGAIPSPGRDTTSLVLVAGGRAVLVDCGGSPVQKLRLAGVDPLALEHVIITHIHPDHAYGLPALAQNLALLERSAELAVRCRPEHVEPLRTLLALFGLWERPGMFPLALKPIGLGERAHAFDLGPLRVSTSPVEHGTMPNFAVRVDVRAEPRPGGDVGGEMIENRGVVYSSDTQPCEAVVRLARGADTLVHEATFPDRHRGRFGVHSTAAEAGEIAARAGVRRLILTHIEADYHEELDALADEARKRFGGLVEIAQELVPYPL